ncbi:MAG TPA: VWA domain-containing protein [Gemmataceae bacterium]|nr:VWA domain-containing protein [Gemmataceae bacterium]
MAKQRTKRPAGKSHARPKTANSKSAARSNGRKSAFTRSNGKPAPRNARSTGLAQSRPKVLKRQPADIRVPADAPLRRTRFTLYNFLAQERGWYLVEPAPVPLPAPPERTVAHSIIIIDRSGSMRRSIEEMKATLLKLLTLDEYKQSNLLVTLLSYAGQGDLKCHFQRAPIIEIMKPNSREQQAIRAISTGGATCISQAVQLAGSVVRPGELTAIMLHSDGYADDPSPTMEVRKLDALCRTIHESSDAFLNTIAYTDAADFRTLARLANLASGNCVRTGDLQQVYDALYNSVKVLNQSALPSLGIPLTGEHEYQVFVSHAAGKVNGGAGPLKITGLQPGQDAVVYRFHNLTKDEYDTMTDVAVDQSGEAVFAFARANLAEGNVNTAKYALASTFDATLSERHGHALTNTEIADMSQDLDDVLMHPDHLEQHDVLEYPRPHYRIPVLDMIRLLDQHKNGFRINIKDLDRNYVRRGLRRVPGTRDESGRLVPPWLKTELVEDATFVPVQSFDLDRNKAALNMRMAQPVRLVRVSDGTPIEEVAGIRLEGLQTYTNYSLMSDGELNVRTLLIQISDPQLFERLKAEGVLELDVEPANRFNSRSSYTLRLDNLPLVPPFDREVNLDGQFDDLAEKKLLSSILAAYLKEEPVLRTPEQLEQLKRYYLSKSLFLNFPTTTEYTNLQEALQEGSVDIRVGYRVDIGSRRILNLRKLRSANAFLDRLYDVYDGANQRVENPKLENALDAGWKYVPKPATNRMKVTPVDTFAKRLFDDFLGLENNGSVAVILAKVGAQRLIDLLAQKRLGRHVDRTEMIGAMADAQDRLDDQAERLFREQISPLVFYVGSTGLLPDEIQAPAQTAGQLSAKYPELDFSNDELDGMFYEIGDTILSVYATNEYYSK